MKEITIKLNLKSIVNLVILILLELVIFYVGFYLGRIYYEKKEIMTLENCRSEIIKSYQPFTYEELKQLKVHQDSYLKICDVFKSFDYLYNYYNK